MDQPSRMWTNEEHKRFLEALEIHGNGTTGTEWQLMADYVGSRNYNEIKLHAHKYFLKLQAATQRKTKDEPTMSLDDGKWSQQEDSTFEDTLAKIEDTVSDRWNQIAALLPGKTAEDVKLRYQKLLYDVARIESGHDVGMHYAVPPAVSTSSSSTPTPAANATPLAVSGTPTTSSLTVEEEGLLLDALNDSNLLTPTNGAGKAETRKRKAEANSDDVSKI